MFWNKSKETTKSENSISQEYSEHLTATVVNVIEAYEPKSILILGDAELAQVDELQRQYPSIKIGVIGKEVGGSPLIGMPDKSGADLVISIDDITDPAGLANIASITRSQAVLVVPSDQIAIDAWQASIVETFGADFGFTFCDLALNGYPGKLLAFVDRRQLVNAELSQIDATAHAQSPTPPSDDEINAKLEGDIAAAEKPKTAGVSFFAGALPTKGA